jgi:hypothetical protein
MADPGAGAAAGAGVTGVRVTGAFAISAGGVIGTGSRCGDPHDATSAASEMSAATRIVVIAASRRAASRARRA